jgi:hypothetical protein
MAQSRTKMLKKYQPCVEDALWVDGVIWNDTVYAWAERVDEDDEKVESCD